jgi:hypothetical protein
MKTKARKQKTGVKAGDLYLHNPRGGNDRLHEAGSASGINTTRTP